MFCHGRLPGVAFCTAPELECGLGDPFTAVLNETTFAFGTTHNVSMSSAAPISGFLNGVANFGGTVKDRRTEERAYGVEGTLSGVTGSEEDDMDISDQKVKRFIPGWCCPTVGRRRGIASP